MPRPRSVVAGLDHAQQPGCAVDADTGAVNGQTVIGPLAGVAPVALVFDDELLAQIQVGLLQGLQPFGLCPGYAPNQTNSQQAC